MPKGAVWDTVRNGVVGGFGHENYPQSQFDNSCINTLYVYTAMCPRVQSGPRYRVQEDVGMKTTLVSVP